MRSVGGSRKRGGGSDAIGQTSDGTRIVLRPVFETPPVINRVDVNLFKRFPRGMEPFFLLQELKNNVPPYLGMVMLPLKQLLPQPLLRQHSLSHGVAVCPFLAAHSTFRCSADVLDSTTLVSVKHQPCSIMGTRNNRLKSCRELCKVHSGCDDYV